MAEKIETEIKLGIPRERVVITPEGVFKTRLEIPYTIEDANYFVTVDKEGSTPESIEAAVKEDARRIVAIKGKTLKI